jgi:hypothetical protein
MNLYNISYRIIEEEGDRDGTGQNFCVRSGRMVFEAELAKI